MLSADISQFPFDDRVQLFEDQDFVKVFQKVERDRFREGERRADFHQSGRECAVGPAGGQFFVRIGEGDAAGRDAPLRGVCRCRTFCQNEISSVPVGVRAQRLVAGFDLRMVREGQAREDDPAGTVFDEAFRCVHIVFVLIFDVDGRVAVVHTGGGAQEDRRAVLLGKVERCLDHFIGFFRCGGVEAGELGKGRERPGVLLGLRRDGTRVVGDEDDHAALHAHILEAHEGVGGHVEADLLHGHQRAGTGIGGAGGELHGGFFVDGPFDVGVFSFPFGDRLQNFRGGGAGVTADDVDACRQRAERDGFVAHQEFGMHRITLLSYKNTLWNTIS